MEFNYVNNPPTSIDELLRLASTIPTYKPKSKESLDYDLFESQVKLLHQSKNVTKTSITECKRWSLTTIVATVTALLAVLITWCTRTLLQYKYAVAQQYLTPPIQLSNRTSTTSTTTFVNITTTFLILSGFNVLFTALAAAVVIFIAPIAAGSGIPEIKCLLNGIKIPHVVRIKTLVAKTVGVILSVAGGLPLGKEGPMIHIGAVIGAGLSQGKSTTCGVDTGFSKLSMFRNDHEKSDFITCGTAAGVAAAFGAPIGGVLFCLEEGTSWWRPSLTWRTFFSAMCATTALDLFLSQVNQAVNFGYFSQPGMLSFGSFVATDLLSPYNVIELFAFSIVGFVGGLLGALFNYINEKVHFKRIKAVRKSKRSSSSNSSIQSTKRIQWIQILSVAMITILVTFVDVLTPYISSLVDPTQQHGCISIETCKNISDVQINPDGVLNTTIVFSPLLVKLEIFDWKLNTIQFNCPNNTFSPSASMSYGSSETTIKYLFHATNEMNCGPSVSVMVWYGMIYFILACIVYGMSIPSGLFVPGIISGALYGRLCGTLFMSYVYPFQFKHASLGTYALIGAASMLGGITRLSIAVTVILVECTGDIQLTVPLMVAVLFARWSANFFNNGLYDIHIELKGLPFLPYTPPKQTSTLRVFSLMTKNPIVFRPIERVGKILDVLQMTEHNGFPICVPVAKNGRGSDNNVSMMRRRRKQRTNEYGGDEGRSNGGIKTENDILGRRLHGLMLRKHLSVLLSKTFKSSVLIASNTFTESKTGVVTRVLNRNRQGDDDVENKEDVDIEDDVDIKDDVEVQDAKETKNTKNAKKMQATKEMQGTKVTKDTKEQKVQRESKTNQKRNRVRTMSHYNDLGLKKPLIVNFKEHVLSWEMLECLYPRYLPVDDDITELERECWIDLRPYMNEAPSIINEHSVVTQAYQMFRHLGLRHLTVIDDSYDVVGMVTRHELVPSKIIQVANDFATLDEDWQNWSPTPKHRLRRFMSAGT